MQVLDVEDLKLKGIKHSQAQLMRRVKAGLFPAPIRIGRRLAWVASEVDQFLQSLVDERDGVVREIAEPRIPDEVGR